MFLKLWFYSFLYRFYVFLRIIEFQLLLESKWYNFMFHLLQVFLHSIKNILLLFHNSPYNITLYKK